MQGSNGGALPGSLARGASRERSTLELDADQLAQREAIERHLASRLDAAGGWLSFYDYMREALYAPGLGYYSAGARKLGAAGDFVTAPELSDLFSATVAAQCAEVLQQCGGEVLEVGPGTGRLAAVLLRELGAGLRLQLLEVSADLRERQRDTIGQIAGAAALPRVRWIERLPERFTGVVFANELLDAFPVERFRMQRGGAVRLGVALQDGQRVWRPASGSDATDPAGASRFAAERDHTLAGLGESLPDGYASELGIDIAPWISAIAAPLVRGAVMLVDYGLPRAHYYHPQRIGGTLRCLYRHRAFDDPLLLPGLSDITAWVDFTRVAEAASAAQLEVAGFCTQAAFLLAGGIEARLQRLAGTPDAAHVARAHAVRRLLLPGEMGEAVKVMALTRDVPAPSGFALQDLRNRL